jgi:hypothetical protein
MNPNKIGEAQGTFGPVAIRQLAIAAQSIGALAVGAIALGALAAAFIGVGRLVIGRAKIKRLEIGELRVTRLHVIESIDTPPQPRRSRGVTRSLGSQNSERRGRRPTNA